MKYRLVSLVFLLIIIITFFGITPLKAQEQGPIIDMHLHAKNSVEGYPSAEPLTDLQTPETSADVLRRTIKSLKRYNVVKALTSGPNVDRYQEAAPGRIVEGCDVRDPSDQRQLDSLRALITEGDCEFIGEFGPQYGGIPPNDPKLKPIFALAESLDVPVGIHIGLGPPGVAYKGRPEYRMKHSNPLLLEDVLVEHPDLRLYVMHAGWPMLDELLGLLYAYPQVYVDMAVINWVLPQAEFHRYLRRIVEAGFGDRVMYGSDQMVWPQSFEMSIEAIRSAPFLSEQQKRDILYNNAARFLRLSEEEIAQHHER